MADVTRMHTSRFTDAEAVQRCQGEIRISHEPADTFDDGEV